MNDQLSIVMLIARFYPVAAGAETQCLRLSEALRKDGQIVRILTQRVRAADTPEIKDGLEIVRVGTPVNNQFGSFSYLVQGFAWIVRNRDSISILHAHLASSPAILAVVAGVALKIPVIVKFAGSRTTGDIATSSATFSGKLKLALIRAFADAVVCPSGEIRDELIHRGFPQTQIMVIPNGVPVDEFTPADDTEKQQLRRTVSIPPDTTVCVYAGRLHRGKGLEFLLAAWEKRSHRTSSLVFLGDGELRPLIDEHIHADPSISCTGWIDRLNDHLRSADIFILPSLGEGMPNALLEAMAAGCACIATRIGGIDELITDGETGILVQPGDPVALAAAIDGLAGDKNLSRKLGQAAAAHIRKKYSMTSIAAQYESAYDTLLRKKLIA